MREISVFPSDLCGLINMVFLMQIFSAKKAIKSYHNACFLAFVRTLIFQIYRYPTNYRQSWALNTFFVFK